MLDLLGESFNSKIREMLVKPLFSEKANIFFEKALKAKNAGSFGRTFYF